MDKLTVDYRDFEKPSQLPKGRLIESKGIQMHVVNGGERTVVIPRAFNAYSGNPFEQLRDRVIANALGARVVGIDIPGVGLNPSSANVPSHRKEAALGNFTSKSDLMITALVNGLELTEEQELDFMGYSLGAWASAAILQSPTFRKYKLRTSAISLVEPVNDQDWHLRTVHRAMIGEFGHEGRYKKETEVHFPTLPTSATSSMAVRPPSTMPSRESLALGRGLRVGFANSLARAVLEDAHDDATGLSQAPLTLYRANGSFAARQTALEQTRETLQQSGQKATRIIEFSPRADTDPHRHLFWHSMGAVAVLTSFMRQVTQ